MEGAGEGKSNGGDDLIFSLQFDPGKVGFPDSALLSRLLGWSKSSSQGRSEGSTAAEGGGETVAAVAVVASAFAAYLVAMYASDHQRPHRPRRRRLAGINSADRPRALPTPDDGLRILSSNDESLENVIHGASVGAWDDEPDIVARVETSPTETDMAGSNASDETDNDQSKKELEEVERLKELWLSLLEREQRLQLRMVELDELREQETAVRELEKRVSVAAVEARLLELKSSSLQEENRRLEARVSELDAVRAKLARAKEKLRELKARVQREQEEAQRVAAVLRDRVTELERNSEERERALAAEAAAVRQRTMELEKNGQERERALAAEAAAVLERMTELEKNGQERERALASEAAALRQANADLEEKNLELALKLQDAQQDASTVNLTLEEDVVKEAKYLRETNERLTRQIEQLHGDHCARVEELVYLKWVNACLRYELRSKDGDEEHPSSGKPEHDGLSARDLSKSMSFRSSEKAKELMLRYGRHGLDGFDPALFSPLHESVYGDGDEYEQPQPRDDVDGPPRSVDPSVTMAPPAPSKRAGSGKLKLLGNIKKLLVTGKRGHGHGDRRSSKIKAASQVRDEHLEKARQWLSSHDILDDDDSYESTPLSSSSCDRTPLSSATTTAGSLHSRETAAATRLLGAETARSRSDVVASSYEREASRYHSTLRLDLPAGRAYDDNDGPRASPEKRELRSPAAAAYMRARDACSHA
ncbi:hypothetical protein GUJ93_ZPchr0008g13270 [Zizania palustris]|nr:hypothetical protein GUJ93_ZPchr0008g13270 [Zizania palustris]